MVKNKRELILGWIAVSIVTIIASLWAYWGGIENFHEGWYSKNLWENIFMMIVQYWLFPMVFIIIGIIGIRFPKAALFLCIAIGIAAGIFFFGAHFTVLWIMILFPLIGIGLLFFFGKAGPKKAAYSIVISIPVMILLATSIFGMIRVSQRIDDKNYGIRKVENENICLLLAPRGPGWPDKGISYNEAQEICLHLNSEGTELMDYEVGIWRLPTVSESVFLQMRRGENAGGIWDAEKKEASYEITPDKETPLWDPNSKIIYYWTDTKADAGSAYIIVYDGGVFTRRVNDKYGSLSFRAVKDCNR
ncbi:MAG: DUF1566 domain-containing protein [Actinomycetota bacterium]|nr:DUF1566 domain-containing protein [Actinomycetota bacterium]